MNEKVAEILKDYLLQERKKNPSTNGTAISKKMDIPPTTFNRLLNGHEYRKNKGPFLENDKVFNGCLQSKMN